MHTIAVLPATDLTSRLELKITRYPRGGALALILDEVDGESYATLSVNLAPSGVELGHDEVAIKDWSENAPLIAPVLATGLFEDTGRRVPTGFVQARVWRVLDGTLLPSPV